MELWIRSQDRENLIKAKNLIVDKCFSQVSAQTEFGIFDNAYLVGMQRLLLGSYKTRIRAIEILDEIQKEISYYGNISDAYTSNHTAIVYEMPQE